MTPSPAIRPHKRCDDAHRGGRAPARPSQPRGCGDRARRAAVPTNGTAPHAADNPGTPRLVCLGLTHKTAPVTVRERFRPDPEQLRAILVGLTAQTRECVILDTCERFEIYAVARRPDPRAWFARLADALGLPDKDPPPHFRLLTDDAVAAHLLRVAAGIESRLLGESHILNQVRHAFQTAADLDTIGPILFALFQTAIHTGRRVRREPLLTRPSLAELAVQRIDPKPRDRRPTVVVVGAGRIAAEVTAVLARRSARIVIANRTLEPARTLARGVNAGAVELSDLPRTLRRADAAIVCTASPSFIINPRTLRHGPRAAITLVDLSVPRNVDPRVTRIPGVRLILLDDLTHDRRPRTQSIAAVNVVIQHQLDRWSRWRRARTVAPRITALLRAAGNRTTGVTPRHKRDLHRAIARIVESAAA